MKTDEEEYQEFRKIEKELGIGPLKRSTIRELIKIKKDFQRKLKIKTLDMKKFFILARKSLEKFKERFPDEYEKSRKKVSDQENKYYT